MAAAIAGVIGRQQLRRRDDQPVAPIPSAPKAVVAKESSGRPAILIVATRAGTVWPLPFLIVVRVQRMVVARPERRWRLCPRPAGQETDQQPGAEQRQNGGCDEEEDVASHVTAPAPASDTSHRGP